MIFAWGSGFAAAAAIAIGADGDMWSAASLGLASILFLIVGILQRKDRA